MMGSLKAGGTRRTPFTVARIPLDVGGRSPDATAEADTGVDVRGFAEAVDTAGSMRDARVTTGAAAFAEVTFGLAPFFAPLREPFLELAPLFGALFLDEEAIRGTEWEGRDCS